MKTKTKTRRKTLDDALGEVRSAKAPRRENTGLNDLADLLLAEVACPMKPEGQGWVSVAEMAAEKGMNDTTLRVQLNKLEKLGKVERKSFICPNSKKRVGFWRVREC